MQNNLFSRKNLEDTLKNYQIPGIENKIEILQKWVREIKNGGILWKTESECEQAFNQDIFQNVLDYTKYPELQYTIEPKWSTVMTAQKADAILWYFSAKQQMDNANHVQAVVEIKDANTSLDAPQKREWHLSPVQQWFKYKPQYEKCVWVIVTNFKEIRLYKDNQITGQSWNLVDLVNPEKDYLNLKFFYYILNAKNFLAIPWEKESKTLKALSEVKIYQKEISNKFYKEYKKLRLWLISDLHKRNPDKETDFVIQKAQKIIDRIIFIHFCEDLGLLPEWWLENQLKSVWTMAGLTVRKALTLFFDAVDKWSEYLHIPQGYNWWLFKSDSDLDSLSVWDQICQDLVSLWDYDYGEDLTVNILWHIFEQSISDLEKIKLDMLWTKLETEDYGEAEWVSKRKKDWIFYTPEYIVDYIVRNSLWKYLEEKYHEIEKEALKWLKKDAGEKAIQQRDNKIYTEYKKVLENIKVCDPACGSGAFLVKVFDYLLSEHQRVANLLQQDSLFDQNEIYKDILQKNIYWVDLNPESVEITKLSLRLKTANKGKKLTNLDSNIKCGNSLIDDPEVAGERAFNWQEQFPEVFENGGFDVVVGNPPYWVSFNSKEKKILKNFDELVPDYEAYIYFISKAFQLIWENKYMSYIFPNTFLSTMFWSKYRENLIEKNHIVEIVDLSDELVFEDASVRTCIFTAKKWLWWDKKTLFSRSIWWDVSIVKTNECGLDLMKEKINNWISLVHYSKENDDIIWKIRDGRDRIIDNFDVSQWLIPYDKYRGHTEEQIKNRVWHADFCKDSTYKKELKWEDLKRYSIKWNWKLWISYWDWLAAPRDSKFFTSERVLVREIVNDKLFCCYEKLEYYNTPSIINIVYRGKDINLKYLLTILNSSLMGWYHQQTSPKAKKWLFPKILVNDVKQLPIPKISREEQKPFIEKADLMLNLNKEFHDELSQTFNFLSQKFWLQKITTKLEKFWELDFSVFKKELKIWKVSMMEEEDLMKRFENKKKYFESKLAEINSVDNSIDEMVFDLYGLTEKERETVRGK